MMEVSATIVAALLAVAAAFGVAFWSAGRSERAIYRKSQEERALALVEEFHSKAMKINRSRAAEALLAPRSETLTYQGYKIDDLQGWESISELLHYFDKMAVLIDAERVDLELLRQLMGRYIHRWSTFYLGPAHINLERFEVPGLTDSDEPAEAHPLKWGIDSLSRHFASPELG